MTRLQKWLGITTLFVLNACTKIDTTNGTNTTPTNPVKPATVKKSYAYDRDTWITSGPNSVSAMNFTGSGFNMTFNYNPLGEWKCNIQNAFSYVNTNDTLPSASNPSGYTVFYADRADSVNFVKTVNDVTKPDTSIALYPNAGAKHYFNQFGLSANNANRYPAEAHLALFK